MKDKKERDIEIIQNEPTNKRKTRKQLSADDTITKFCL